MMWNVEELRKDFPALQQERNGNPPIYFDNASMALKPIQVIEAMNEYYYKFPASGGGRSLYWFARKVDEKVAEARRKIKELINAKYEEEIIFVKNTTEAINLVARSLSFQPKDVVITTDKEHNSNLCPWQELQKRGVIKKHITIPSNPDNTFSMENFKDILAEHGKAVRIVSLSHVSNLDGTDISDPTIKQISSLLKAANSRALLILDAAQSVPHRKVDVQDLGVDFIAFSIHKLCGPTGVGILYGRKELLENAEIMQPFISGGGTVEDTSFLEYPKYLKPPFKFEAGLQNYAGIIGAGVSAEYIKNLGLKEIEKYEKKINNYFTERIKEFSEVKIIGPESAEKRAGILTFFLNIPGLNIPEELDVDIMLDSKANIMIRKGYFCVHSWFHKHRKVFKRINEQRIEPMPYRVSFYFYNTEEECDVFLKTFKEIVSLIKKQS